MNHEEQQLLTPEERTEFREMERMFESAGWRSIITRLQQELEHGPVYWFWNAQNWEDVVAARARCRAVAELANYETMSQNHKDNLLQGRRMKAVDEADDASLQNF
jgi:hypothetical protein